MGGLATLPGPLVTDFYDLALAEACRARSRSRSPRPRGWTALLVAAGWLVPFGSEVSLVLSVVGAALIALGFGWTGLAVARTHDQTWAERAFVRTTLVKAPKIAVESAA